ncbi:hypothetical protein EMIHUDRAFT_205877 [Emiliania huxleyi CCMP1516]|uniref:Uncharacterized protein n=2 Tax=Emiliania huxleyi TaxID=2903 RepID=A0A0D3IQY3_EMIH1|nr:hypothetical protein EMIHUDRAFT_246736 [Emiliania huxleyi CCMP1516]XP_005778190.1 hypothetical protein EMIHUDRAFT_205877 [Emiliania huxleyi CCMP1516]EOD13668.1 hypothetical protein EMIHUDRAFT_246736 [Emiliania huxleyi CCMP1516]EOD25761.1 hypothetical protein EMIHUDRAFT_205877 [Emiliania huxleyi CCMP1516]|eukprot:XP_005766097.1 hypothetical protein EMIHUDRAFT_246736 [Emiliania huxleyi CCMP1516]
MLPPFCAQAAALSVRQPKATTEPTVATEAPEPPAAPDTSPKMEVEPAAPDAQALATGAFYHKPLPRLPPSAPSLELSEAAF